MIKQLNLFTNISSSVKNKETVIWTLFVDGAARHNPGPAGAGIYLEKNGILALKEGYYLGKKTNNQAEYLALLLGLFILDEHIQKNEKIQIVSDSQLLVRQLTAIYKVKDHYLKLLHTICKEKMYTFNATIQHVLREENIQADEMANYGIDNKISPPKHYLALLKNYDIVL